MIMRQISAFLLRAVLTVVAGVLMIEYRDEMVSWLTKLLGVIFFTSGVISCVVYYAGRRRAPLPVEQMPEGSDNNGNAADAADVPAPAHHLGFGALIVGLGSIILGIILVTMTGIFTSWLTYIFAALLILGALSQMVSLVQAMRMETIGWVYWIMPVAVFLVGILAIVYPEAIAAAPLFVIGWTLVIYGVAEFVNGIKLFAVRRRYAKLLPPEFGDDTETAVAEPSDTSAESGNESADNKKIE